MKRGRRFDESSDSECESDDDGGEEMTASHPWGVRPWGNFHYSKDEERDLRGRGMGLFSCLDDATVVLCLSMLDATGLATLGQTCRFLAVFCDHEPLWKDLLLRDLAGNWRWRGTFRDSYVCARFGVESAHKPFVVEGFYSDFLHKSWLCATARFNSSWVGIDTIPREKASELSLEDFRRKYEIPNQPVIITGAIDEWPLFKDLDKWVEENNKAHFKVGDMRMELGSFLEYSKEALDEDPLYLFEKNCGPRLDGKYSVPPYFARERDLFGLLDEDKRPDYRWLIAGGACSGSAFHIDPNGTSAWNAVLSGSKKWLLAPKAIKIPGVHPNADYGEVATPVSVVEWFIDFFEEAKAQEVPLLEAIQRPGDVIFVPFSWFHCVLNLEPTIAVTHNFVTEVNLYHVMKFLDTKPDQVSGVPASERHLLGSRFRAALREKAPDILKALEQREAEARKPSVWEMAKTGQTFSLLG